MTKISIGITTRNRINLLSQCADNIFEYLPNDCSVDFSIVDDASDNPVTVDIIPVIPSWWRGSISMRLFRFEKRAGIPAAKNKCLELSRGEHVFLFDDDTYPLKQGWELPYINSGKHHLCYTFLPSHGVKGGFKVHALGNGCMMYFTRECLNRVGGFDTRFGMGKYEHVNLSRRIYNAGLTDNVFEDVVGSEKLLYCHDSNHAARRSFSDKEAERLLKSGWQHFQDKLHSKEFIPFKSNHNGTI